MARLTPTKPCVPMANAARSRKSASSTPRRHGCCGVKRPMTRSNRALAARVRSVANSDEKTTL
eukprot:2647503-Pleurochrysis_carterae.AAC.1